MGLSYQYRIQKKNPLQNNAGQNRNSLLNEKTMPKPSLLLKITPLLAASLMITAAAPLCHAQGDEPKSPLAQEMGGIQRDVRSLKKALSDPSQSKTALSLVQDMEAHATKAKDYKPAKTKSIPADQQDQFVADYQKAIDGLIADIKKLEQAVSSGDTATANTLLDQLNTDKRDGHKKFNGRGGGPGGPGGPGGQWGGGGPGGPGGGPGGPGGGAPPPPPAQTGTGN
jgi:soluble cytochrome b562